MNDTAAHTGDFTSIQFTEDSVLGALTGAMENISDLVSDGTTFSQGQVIYVPCTSVTLTSGAALLYKIMPLLGIGLHIGDTDSDSVVGPILDGILRTEAGAFLITEAGQFLAFD